MKKVICSVALATMFAGVALAEESGVFLGAQVGAGGSKIKLSGTTTADDTAGAASGNVSATGVSFGIVAGYKQFFNDSFGLRYYANFDYTDAPFKEEGVKMTSNVMNYGVNVDALYNFVNSGDNSFGAFLGLGLGANTWGGKGIKDAKDSVAGVGKFKTTLFDFHLNVGVRGVFAKAHGVELAVKVPFLESELWKYSLDGTTAKITAKQNYNVAVRYTFSF